MKNSEISLHLCNKLYWTMRKKNLIKETLLLVKICSHLVSKFDHEKLLWIIQQKTHGVSQGVRIYWYNVGTW